MRAELGGILLLCCLLANGRLEAAGPEVELIPANAPAFQYLGAWQEEGGRWWTIYPGGQVRFHLKGQARLELEPGTSGSVLAAVRKDAEVVWRGLLGPEAVEVDGGESGAVFSIVYLAARNPGFDPAMSNASAAELRFQGVSLKKDGVLGAPSKIRDEILVDFIGDSITAGVDILGRSEKWEQDSDASLTYAFQLGEKMGARYRIRGFRGENLGDIAPKIHFFRKDIPFSTNELPDIVFVNMGANDREKNEARYREGMRNLLNGVFAGNAHVHVVLLNFYRMTPNRLPTLKELAQSFPRGAVVCFDARPYLVGYSDQGVHPDVQSHRLLADALYAYLLQCEWVGPDWIPSGAMTGHIPPIHSTP